MRREFCFSLGVLVLASGFALRAQSTGKCTPKDMQGAWATQPNGFFTAGPVDGPFSAVGTLFFDGVNRFGGVATSSFKGHVIFPFAADGSYTLTADCRLTVFEETLRIGFDGWLVNNKNDVIFFEPDPISVSVNNLRRQSLASCDLTTIQDTWTISTTGYNIITSGRFAWNAHLTFDGKGGVTGTATKSDDGVLTRDGTYAGTYTVNPADCSLSMSVGDNTGFISGYYGSVFDSGKQLILIMNNVGQVVTGFGKRQ